ncbi:hypothetical protein MPRG_06720 [Mycobacterium paragordonae]|uniref:Uncharacterized protein n=1 Tax=Mycobacterium paragordonae TaxID=1389713 RepID=A0ABQ1BZ00_9MYCO|nr:hypothetical protein MPRG_06720 [Mycobacterium paragordonae]
MTVPPARTVKVAGANAKLSMLTWSPPTGAVTLCDAVPPGEAGIEDIPVIPGMAPDPKLTEG